VSELPEEEPGAPVLPRKRRNEYPLETKSDEIINAFAHCYRPLILAGGGVVAGGASEAMCKCSAKYNIPIAVTLPGMGIIIPESYRDSVNILGMAGIYGSDAAKAAMDQCDICIAVGCRMSERTIPDFDLFGAGRLIIHCDIDPAELNKNVRVSTAVVAEASEFFDFLSDLPLALNSEYITAWNESLLPLKARKQLEMNPNKLSGREILREIDNCQAEYRDAVYVTDVGNHQMRAAREIAPLFERGFITSAGLGAMGFGLPAAIGAAYALPDNCRQVILLCGDGGFQMTMEELALVHNLPVPIKIFIFDNSGLGMIERMQNSRLEGRLTDSDFDFSPNYSLIGDAYGIKNVTLDINSRQNIQEIIREIIASNENILVRCVTVENK